MPDHVKKILKRAYLEDKPYNDIFFNLESAVRLNGLGAADVTLVLLRKIEPDQTAKKQEPREDRAKDTKIGYCSVTSR